MKSSADDMNLSRPYRLYVLGDSNSLAFRDLLVTIPQTGESAFFYSTYIPGLHAEDVFLPDIGLHPEIKSVLKTFALVVGKDDTPTHLSFWSDVHYNTFASGLSLLSPVIMIVTGDIDLRGKIYRMVDSDSDVILPFDSPYSLQAGASIIPLELIEAELQVIIGNLVRGAVELQDKYGARVFLHGVNPPTMDQERFWNINKFDISADKRYKLSLLFNTMLKAKCAECDVGYFDIWRETTRGGFLLSDYELDGAHLSPEAAKFTLDRLFHGVSMSVKNKTNFNRYKAVVPRAANRTQSKTEPASGLVEGCVFRTVPGVAENLSRLKAAEGMFTSDMPRLFDWVAAAVYPEKTRIVSLSSEELGVVRDALDEPKIAAGIRAILGCDFVCISCKLIVYTEASDVTRNAFVEQAPPEVLRGLLVLEAGSVRLAALNDKIPVAEHLLEAGDLLIYRPSQTSAHCGENFRVIEMTIMPRLSGQKILIASAGISDWPADPFRYSLQNVETYPRQNGPSFSAPSLVYADSVNGEPTSDFIKEATFAIKAVAEVQGEIPPPPNPAQVEKRGTLSSIRNLFKRS